ncbi:MauE/DoxX family redox-associated membrane protein [Flavobacterium humi]|uniref:Protein tlpB n=1 Tax=Flavobacterium humi TaxID=2562683 RepID=A0A4Z0LA03_9FLAO|nr:MauE/DoxX family redox-associated membrane protein [Flavobacterium humi]TGD58040.1 protein tlpB [Flavobacterium humi]
MEKVKSILPWPLRIIISFLFIISAIAKMYPSPYFAISTFEVKQLYPLGFSDTIAPYFSRFLIGIELALGILILQNNFLRKIIIPATILLLAVFTTHLTIVTIQDGGNSGNCGCFGSLLPMTPIEAIIKNVVAMALLVYLLYLLPKEANGNRNFWFLATVTLASILALFMLAPIQPASHFELAPGTSIETDTIPAENNTITTPIDAVGKTEKKDSVKSGDTQKTMQKTAQTTILTEPAPRKSGYAKFFAKIDNGRKTLCFFVPGCDHCRQAAKELTELKQKNADFPEVSIIFMNEEADLIPDFFKEAGAEYPYTIVEVIPFWNLLGPKTDTPGVKYLWNGNTYKYYNGITDKKFDPVDYQKLINKPYSELAPKK